MKYYYTKIRKKMNLIKWNKIANSFYMKDNLHIAGIHTALDIWRFAVFFCHTLIAAE